MTVHRTATVPPGMSCVNALMALWHKSRFVGMGHTISTEPISSAAKVTSLFTEKTFFDWLAGLPIKANFSKFLELDISIYDDYFGAGAAEKALEEYNKIPSNERFDKNDSYEFKELTTLKDNSRELYALQHKIFCENFFSIP